jgi:Metallo-peptidase family M12/Bacterial pre-peptidase C-terminal domain/Putative binding domain, N-terminal
MQYPGKRISNISPRLASPIFCISVLVGAIVISGFLTRPIDAGRPAISSSGQTPGLNTKLVGKTPQRRDDPEIAKALKKYDVIRLDRAELKSQMQKNGRLLLKTSAGDFDLELTPHDLRSQDYQSQMIGADGIAGHLPITPIKTFKGPVNGSSRAQARMTLTNMGLEGIVITESARYFLQSARTFSQSANEDEFVFYNGIDTTQSSGTCGVTLADEVAARERMAKESGETLQAESLASASSDVLSPMRVIRLATEADAEYVAALGGAAQANDHILAIMNQVDGIYQVELGLTFQVIFQNAWSDAATDPYVSTDSIALLKEFADYWNAHFAGTQRDIGHFWTGKDMDDAIGRAYLATVCRFPSQSYGVSQRTPADPANPITATTISLTAHEIGHNFDAVHPSPPTIPDDIGKACGNSIMQGLTSRLTFCSFSRSQILSYVTSWGSCLANSSTVPPSYPPCAQVPLDSSLSANGELTTTDCRSPARGIFYFADQYTFEGQAGQRLHINMNPVTPGFDPYLYLIAPDGFIIGQVSTLGNPSRLPFSGSFTLPQTGKYIIEVTSSERQAFGSYAISVTLDGCVLSVSPTSQHFTAGGGSGTINVTATGSGCSSSSYLFATFPFVTPWLTVQTNSATGSQSLNFTVQANTSTPGRRAFLIVGTVFGDGLSIPITQSGTGPDCSLTPIGMGQTINGTLATSDCVSPSSNVFADRYSFSASAGQEVAISASFPNRGAFLTLFGPDQRIILTDDGALSLGHARIPGGMGMLTLGLPGTYVVEVTGSGTGPYSVTLTTSTPQAPPVLLTEENSDVAAAVTSVTALRAPFSLTDAYNFSSDGRTRMAFFVTNLDLFPGEDRSAVSAIAEDAQGNTFTLPVECVGKMPSFDFVSQVVVALPGNLPPGQEFRVRLSLHGLSSNKARLAIK